MMVSGNPMHLSYEAFSNHVVQRRTSSSILLACRDTSNLWTEFLLGAGGTLIIHGDGPDLVFRSWRKDDSIEDLMMWVGDGPARRYIASKVLMGETYVFDESAARQDLRLLLKENEDSPEFCEEIKDLLADASYWETEETMRRRLLEIDEEAYNLGEVPSQNFEWAVAACQRCVECFTSNTPRPSILEVERVFFDDFHASLAHKGVKELHPEALTSFVRALAALRSFAHPIRMPWAWRLFLRLSDSEFEEKFACSRRLEPDEERILKLREERRHVFEAMVQEFMSTAGAEGCGVPSTRC